MTDTRSGILKLTNKGAGVLVNPAESTERVFVPVKLIRQYGLPEGVTVTGPAQSGRRGPQLTEVAQICGMAPAAFRERTPFQRLTAVSPDQRFNLSASGEKSTRLVDLVAPIGRGTRGLIVSPPKAGKTVLLEHLAQAIQADDPEARLIILLIDERPEEVTHFRRTIPGAEVFASSNDQPTREHVELTELMLAHIRTDLECGHDVVVLVDSLTRLVRAFNLRGGRGRNSRTLSGGVEASALQIPRRFFGLARNIENGGSVTILATILVDTGSRMDQFIFEEFKGTGNSEIVLDRSLAEAYIFPAIDLAASSTRKSERLYEPEEHRRLTLLRRALAGRPPRQALQAMLDLLERYPTNEELLQNIDV